MIHTCVWPVVLDDGYRRELHRGSLRGQKLHAVLVEFEPIVTPRSVE